MKILKNMVFTTISLMSCFSLAVSSQQPEPPINNITSISDKLEMSGFADFITSINGNDDDEIFNIGQAELSFLYPVTDKSEFSIAVSYDDDSFGIGSFLFEHKLYNNSANLSNLKLGFGQFDIPFGIDWEVYSSFDRELISSPIINNETHDSWNDMGIYINYNNHNFNSYLFIVNGFDHVGHNEEGFHEGMQSDFAFGSRVQAALYSNLKIGGSYAYVYNDSDTYNMYLWGVDIIWEIANFHLKTEYINHSFDGDFINSIHDDGYYGQIKYNFNNWYLLSRYSVYNHLSDDPIEQVSNGVGSQLTDNIITRIEWQYLTDTNDHLIFWQLAVGF